MKQPPCGAPEEGASPQTSGVAAGDVLVGVSTPEGAVQGTWAPVAGSRRA